ncbi:MAG: hypothetical protein A2W91_00040 [Bacteroidetes bacterium GWF2_38_335]|nr:MAG: hypothetical protein A2W91_00040 [Bacteroidetes bacterium GWF2_38_335]OFY79737.1 MAG: hypothetical protein A2281_09635 [Bacteroidetes bacterium RIFOXYA12_FULL_38_20]
MFAKEKPKVYFTADISSAGVQKVYEMIKGDVTGKKIAIKVHFGEEGNQNFLKPELIKDLAVKLNATLVETNVLYVSKRRYTESHIQLAIEHGFDFCPIDILDSEGETVIPIEGGKHYKEVKAGSHLDNYDSYIIFSHFKGHGMSGFGGAIKNVGMGLASVAGKMAQHSSSFPTVAKEKCTKCGACEKKCPAGAITIDPEVKIDTSKCIGCGQCIGVCYKDRVYGVPWSSTDNNTFMERLVEYTLGIIKNRNVVYINVLANISPDCDCAKNARKPFMKDIGIVAGTDIVAVEKASHDLVDKAHKCKDTFLKENSVSGKRQIEYAYKLGLGNKKYVLVDLDKKK